MKHPQHFDGPGIEVLNPRIPRGGIRHALFDFDGTLSLIREGWQGVMVPMMVEVLRQTPHAEGEADLRALVEDYVAELTGEQTIYQMIRLAEEVSRRGGVPRPPLEYKREYHAQLWERVKKRVVGLKSGVLKPEAFLVPGAREFLAALRERGVDVTLASGTDEEYVRDEAAALGVAAFFDEIHGARDDYERATKKRVIQHLLSERNLRGDALVGFGDGYVEIENVKAVGGLAVGVASNESERRGIDAWKRERLIRAGADVIVPDFREGEALMRYLFGE